MAGVRTIKITGQDIHQYLDKLAALRIEVFRHFPYLYDGSQAYEKKYLQTYAKANGSAIILATEQEEVVGASTCIPLSEETSALKQSFKNTAYNMDEIMFFGESVLKETYRGRGIGVEFFRQREGHARQLEKKYATFCAVQRTSNHPLRPAGYQSLHNFWKKRGYTPLPQVSTQMEWKDVDQSEESSKTLNFWIKKLV
ncbi:GNAT family N-acetyltransferase [Porifericola rhodea]|uniref:GNAT family N-acetyltransferase n=1 Tax=Porifericola rhodea TaxID=930972 RepID=UPI0026650E95|nr:GNAT family N-acetyltransferase [Porifericola rhodea]WKN31338.1 GNAT family N-acetyltransferase [Porifericola rhodea]